MATRTLRGRSSSSPANTQGPLAESSPTSKARRSKTSASQSGESPKSKLAPLPKTAKQPRASKATSFEGENTSAFAVGDKVRWLNHEEQPFGTVRFIGEVGFANGTWIGVALHEELGKNDGTGPDGKFYFECLIGHGVFVKEKTLIPASRQDRERYSEVAETLERRTSVPAQSQGEITKLKAMLNEAIEEHDVQALRDLIPQATWLGVPPNELAHARRLLDYCEYEKEVRSSISVDVQKDLAALEDVRSELVSAREEVSSQSIELAELRSQLKIAREELSVEAQSGDGAIGGVREAWGELCEQLATAREELSAERSKRKQLEAKLSGTSRRSSRRESDAAFYNCLVFNELAELSEIEWQETVPPPPEYLSRKSHIAEAHRRAITMTQINQLGAFLPKVFDSLDIRWSKLPRGSNSTRISWDGVNLHVVNKLVLEQLTRPHSCSFVELVADDAQDAVWFISHWWGTPFKDTLRMMNFHCTQKKLRSRTPYWICAFANNPPEVQDELKQPTLSQTTFFKVIHSQSCKGTLLLMDASATPFRRAWCLIELFVTTTGGKEGKAKPKLLEVATVIPEGYQIERSSSTSSSIVALLIDEGDDTMGERFEQEGFMFPPSIAKRAMDVDIAQAEVTNKSDKRNILRLTVGGSSDEPPEKHPSYQKVNNVIRKVFAPRALLNAALVGSVSEVKQILDDALCSADVWDTTGCTPVHLAATYGNVAVLQALVQAKADLDLEDIVGVTPVSAAVQQGQIGTLRLLLDARADVKLASEGGATPTLLAARGNNVAAMRLLLEVRADANFADEEGETPLCAAHAGKHSEVFRVLLSTAWREAMEKTRRYSQTEVRVKETHRRAITINQLNDLGDFCIGVLEANQIQDLNPNEKFNVGRITWDKMNLYHMNDFAVMPLTKEKVCSFVELVCEGPQEPVWFISHWWGTKFKLTLKMLNYHLKEHKNEPTTPYWMCTFANNQHNLAELEEPNLLKTPFAQAIMMPSCEGTIMLLDEKTTPFRRAWCTLEIFVTTVPAKKKENGAQLFEIATVIPEGDQFYHDEISGAKTSVPESVALLVDETDGSFGESLEKEHATYPPVVGSCAMLADICIAEATNPNDKKNILRLISETPKDTDPPKKHERYDEVNRAIHIVFAPRALLGAAMHGDLDELKAILEDELCSVDVETMEGCTPVFQAALYGQVDAMRLLISAKADPDLEDLDGTTPISAAVQHDRIDAVQVLLEARADPNIPAEDGTTPLYFAASGGNEAVLKLLLKSGADVHCADENGESPLDVAQKENHDHIVQLLKDAGADANSNVPSSKVPMGSRARRRSTLDMPLGSRRMSRKAPPIGSSKSNLGRGRPLHETM